MQEEVCSPCHFMLAQVRDNELLPVEFMRALHPRGNDWMTLRRIATNDENKVSLLHVGDGTGIATIADSAEQTLRRRRLAVARAVVNIVGPDDGSRQFLHQIAFFIRTLGR